MNSFLGFKQFGMLLLLSSSSVVHAQDDENKPVSALYDKFEYSIPMRDGVKLHTVAYVPKDKAGKHPILMERTPYSAGPYGPGSFAQFGGSPKFREAGYIFAYQDVRGQYMSEGTFVNVRPMLKAGETGIDESTDTYDTIDFLVKNVPNNNGNVGLWGISYPGFYAAAGAINTHPALKAVSPQAPVSEWFIGDDVHHNGAFFLQDNFDFSLDFDNPRSGPEKEHKGIEIDRQGRSAYEFFLKAGTLTQLEAKYLHGQIPYWLELYEHGNYDSYWKSRSILDKMKNVKCAVLTVGGLFDAEDMYGALNMFQYTGRQNKGIPNYLVMGPWYHGMWASGDGQSFGGVNFGSNTSRFFQDEIEFPFFDKYLRGQNIASPAKATIFQTGKNVWRKFEQWPPKGLGKMEWYLQANKGLSTAQPKKSGADSYVNDPAAPTPYIKNLKATQRPAEYMLADQRWAASRSDVLTYEGPVLKQDVTVGGAVDVDFWVSTTGTDSDFVVKVIDVWANGNQQLLRGDIMRGKFRNSYEKPEPFVPGKPTRLHFKMNDVLHTFQKGHKIMVQVQSSWFPLVDRNPNKFVDIYKAKPEDFQKATIRVYHDPKMPSKIVFGTLPQ